MKRLVCILTALLPALASAQEGSDKPASMEFPNPKHPEHALLATLAGDWEFTMKMEAMPGVPGMEKPTESTGTEHAELICNGLWLKCAIDSTFNGEPFGGLWLAGYDPYQKKYASWFVCSMAENCELSYMDGTYDAATKTWTWSGSSSHGDMKSVFVMKSPDESVETCFMKTPDGKEMKCMEITRRRAKGASAKMVAKGKITPPGEEHLVLHKDVGEWDATVKMTAPGMPASEEKAKETVKTICNGRWLWSDFKGQMMGQPFEGHALVGYVPTEKQYVSLWIDSTSPVASKTTGNYDPSTKSFNLAGKTKCPMGTDMAMSEKLTWKDENTRHLAMEFESEGQKSQMEITYRRAQPVK